MIEQNAIRGSLTTEMLVSQTLHLVVEHTVFHDALEAASLKALHQKVDAEHATLRIFVLLSLRVDHGAKARVPHSFANVV